MTPVQDNTHTHKLVHAYTYFMTKEVLGVMKMFTECTVVTGVVPFVCICSLSNPSSLEFGLL